MYIHPLDDENFVRRTENGYYQRLATRARLWRSADQWLEVFEPDNMGDTTVMTKGCVKVHGAMTNAGSNRKGTGGCQGQMDLR